MPRPCCASGRGLAGPCAGVWFHEPQVLLTGPTCPSLEAFQPQQAFFLKRQSLPRPASPTALHGSRVPSPNTDQGLLWGVQASCLGQVRVVWMGSLAPSASDLCTCTYASSHSLATPPYALRTSECQALSQEAAAD